MSLNPPEIAPGEAAAIAARTAARAADEGIAEVSYALLDAPVGRLVIAATSVGLVRIAYELENGGLDAVLERIAQRLSPRIVQAPARLDGARRELQEYFDGERREFGVDLDFALAGGGFARRVLHAAIEIPFGATSSYREIAGAAGSPNAYRAAGNALGANPLPIVVPCHRVLASTGGLGGYTGGLQRKRLLLAIEGRDGG